ncbi:MAG: ABC transporter substrate-binding protein, partial [Pseudothermotoga sp.]
NADYALKLIEFVSSPKMQAKYIVERFNWYPAIGDDFVAPYLTKEVLDRIYKDVKQAELLKYGKPMPLLPYKQDMQEAYEKWVEK